MTILALLDGLATRGLLDRVETLDVRNDGVSLRLSPPPTKPLDPKDPIKLERVDARDEEDAEGLKYASS